MKRLREIKKKAKVKYLYGLSWDAYNQILHRQNGGCAICGSKGQLGVDHCHTTGEVRGLLCRGCNYGIGNFKDDPKRLREAVKYLNNKRRDS